MFSFKLNNIFQSWANCFCLRTPWWDLLGRAPRQPEGLAVLESCLRRKGTSWPLKADTGGMSNCSFFYGCIEIFVVLSKLNIFSPVAEEAVPICFRVHIKSWAGGAGPGPRLPPFAVSHHLRENSWHTAQGIIHLQWIFQDLICWSLESWHVVHFLFPNIMIF